MRLRQWRRLERRWKREHIRKRRWYYSTCQGRPVTSVYFGGVKIAENATVKMLERRGPFSSVMVMECTATCSI